MTNLQVIPVHFCAPFFSSAGMSIPAILVRLYQEGTPIEAMRSHQLAGRIGVTPQC